MASRIIEYNTRRSNDGTKVKEYIRRDVTMMARVAFNICGTGVYGGIVRDFLLRDEDTNDIDVWLKSEEDIAKWLEALPKKWIHKPNVYDTYDNSVTFNKENYPFRVERIHLTTPRKYFVDLVISPELPVNDFNVNRMVFNGKEYIGDYYDDIKNSKATTTLAYIKGRLPEDLLRLRTDPRSYDKMMRNRESRLRRFGYNWKIDVDLSEPRGDFGNIPKVVDKRYIKFDTSVLIERILELEAELKALKIHPTG